MNYLMAMNMWFLNKKKILERICLRRAISLLRKLWFSEYFLMRWNPRKTVFQLNQPSFVFQLISRIFENVQNEVANSIRWLPTGIPNYTKFKRRINANPLKKWICRSLIGVIRKQKRQWKHSTTQVTVFSNNQNSPFEWWVFN